MTVWRKIFEGNVDMAFDKGIPIPSERPKWDFSTAEIGDSLSFYNHAEAMRFSRAIKVYAHKNNKLWGALKCSLKEGEGYRVWIVARKKPVHHRTNASWLQSMEA
jgi:hypothetical protein